MITLRMPAVASGVARLRSQRYISERKDALSAKLQIKDKGSKWSMSAGLCRFVCVYVCMYMSARVFASA